jgi:hypothetical protein
MTASQSENRDRAFLFYYWTIIAKGIRLPNKIVLQIFRFEKFFKKRDNLREVGLPYVQCGANNDQWDRIYNNTSVSSIFI